MLALAGVEVGVLIVEVVGAAGGVGLAVPLVGAAGLDGVGGAERGVDGQHEGVGDHADVVVILDLMLVGVSAGLIVGLAVPLVAAAYGDHVGCGGDVVYGEVEGVGDGAAVVVLIAVLVVAGLGVEGSVPLVGAAGGLGVGCVCGLVNGDGHGHDGVAAEHGLQGGGLRHLAVLLEGDAVPLEREGAGAHHAVKLDGVLRGVGGGDGEGEVVDGVIDAVVGIDVEVLLCVVAELGAVDHDGQVVLADDGVEVGLSRLCDGDVEDDGIGVEHGAGVGTVGTTDGVIGVGAVGERVGGAAGAFNEAEDHLVLAGLLPVGGELVVGL